MKPDYARIQSITRSSPRGAFDHHLSQVSDRTAKNAWGHRGKDANLERGMMSCMR